MKNTALITGSTGGLGSCFVKIHAKNGGDLILVGQNETKLLAQKKEVEEKYKIKVEIIVADLTDSAQVDNIYIRPPRKLNLGFKINNSTN